MLSVVKRVGGSFANVWPLPINATKTVRLIDVLKKKACKKIAA